MEDRGVDAGLGVSAVTSSSERCDGGGGGDGGEPGKVTSAKFKLKREEEEEEEDEEGDGDRRETMRSLTPQVSHHRSCSVFGRNVCQVPVGRAVGSLCPQFSLPVKLFLRRRNDEGGSSEFSR